MCPSPDYSYILTEIIPVATTSKTESFKIVHGIENIEQA